MTEPGSATPRVDALRNARTDNVEVADERTRNQVAPADDVLAAQAPQADEIAAAEAAARLEADDTRPAEAAGFDADPDDDLPGTAFRLGATSLVTDRLLAEQPAPAGSHAAAPHQAGPQEADSHETDVVADEVPVVREYDIDQDTTPAAEMTAPTDVVVADVDVADEDAPGRDALPTVDPAEVEIVETEPTELVEEAPRAADAAVTTTAATAVATPAIAPLFREPRTTDSVATEASLAGGPTTEEVAPVETEAEKTAVIDRDAEREARQKRLGVVAAPAPAADPVVPVTKPTRTTDKWHGSLGMFLLRLVTGALLITQGWAHLAHLSETQAFFANSILPSPNYWALGVGIAEVVAGVLLVIGLATRFAGLLLLAIQIVMLGFFIYGKSGAIFTPGQPGFKGDTELLLAAIGLLFLLLGGGGLAIDRIVRRNRARARQERMLGNTV